MTPGEPSEGSPATNASSVLVAYASRHGSTKGVAERMTTRLRERGHVVELRSVDQLDAVAGYAAIVFGSPVYDQRRLPEGDRFVQDNLDALARRPVWLFSVGTFGDRRRVIAR